MLELCFWAAILLLTLARWDWIKTVAQVHKAQRELIWLHQQNTVYFFNDTFIITPHMEERLMKSSMHIPIFDEANLEGPKTLLGHRYRTFDHNLIIRSEAHVSKNRNQS